MAHDNPTTPMQFCDALRSLGLAKTLLTLLVVLCLLVQVASFVLVDFVGVLDGDGLVLDTDNTDNAETWFRTLSYAMAASKFAAVVSAGLLMLTLMFAVKISLVGRVGATAGFLGAFFWSLILLAILVPWQQIISTSFASGSTFNMGQLIDRGRLVRTSWGADEETATIFRQSVYYARFLAYPILTLVIAVVVALKFGRGLAPLRQAAPSSAAPTAPDAGAPVESSAIQM